MAVKIDRKRQELNKMIHGLGFSFEFQFIPFSQTRPCSDSGTSLNYIVTTYHTPLGGEKRKIHEDNLKLSYARCPASDSAAFRRYSPRQRAIIWECEHGLKAMKKGHELVARSEKCTILPDACDVMGSIMQNIVISSSMQTYEAWCRATYFTPCQAVEDKYKKAVAANAAMEEAIGIENMRRIKDMTFGI